jgi:hypothetical protein
MSVQVASILCMSPACFLPRPITAKSRATIAAGLFLETTMTQALSVRIAMVEIS